MTEYCRVKECTRDVTVVICWEAVKLSGGYMSSLHLCEVHARLIRRIAEVIVED